MVQPDGSFHAPRPRRNWPMTLGLLMVLWVAALATAGPALAPRDPLETNSVAQVDGEWIPLPYPPLTVPGFPLGSDTFGRDLLSRLLWGVRPTVILVVLVSTVRLAVGVALGVSAGWSRGQSGRILDGIITAALTVPTLIAALAVITAVGIQRGLPAFLLGLTATGWADTARLVSEQARSLRSQPYVEAARAMGASSLEIVIRHVLRQITPLLGMLLAFEAGSTLMAVAALGFLGYYLGGAVWIEVTDFSARAVSGLPELGQMLANSWQILKPWATVATGTVVFLAILGFNLVGEGLRRRLATAELGRRTRLGDMLGRLSAGAEETFLMSGAGGKRRQQFIGALAALTVVAFAFFAWRPWQEARERAAVDTAWPLVVPGGHLWANDRGDPYGTLASSESEPIAPILRWVLIEPEGFSGSPVVDARQQVYVAVSSGALYALARAGEIVWQSSLPAEPVGIALGPPPASSPGDGGRLYVTDPYGGLSAFTLDGGYLWRTRSATGRRASSGPVVSADGTVFYTVVDRIEAVAPDGRPIWTSARLPGRGEAAPRLAPDGSLLFVQDAVVDASNGELVDFSALAAAGQAGIDAAYIIGADGRTYLRESHAVYEWQMTADGPERVRQLSWNYQGATLYLPADSGVTLKGDTWLLYGSGWDDLRLIFLSRAGLLIGNLHYPQRFMRLIGVDAANHAYICGLYRLGDPQCIACSPGTTEPTWKLTLDRSTGKVTGGALAAGRLYVTTEDGVLYAIGAQ